jgi:hypothetical protein
MEMPACQRRKILKPREKSNLRFQLGGQFLSHATMRQFIPSIQHRLKPDNWTAAEMAPAQAMLWLR